MDNQIYPEYEMKNVSLFMKQGYFIKYCQSIFFEERSLYQGKLSIEYHPGYIVTCMVQTSENIWLS